MAELINCQLVEDVSVGSLTVSDIDLPHVELRIKPDNSLDVPLVSEADGGTGGYARFTVAAADFQDYTHELPSVNWQGMIAHDPVLYPTATHPGNLGITLKDSISAHHPDNEVIVEIDLDDNFYLSADTTITVDIGGAAQPDTTRDAILALRTDFANQVRGGTITSFNAGVFTDNVYGGAEGVVDVTFTAADNITDVNSGQDYTPVVSPNVTSSIANSGNDFSQEDDIIYVKGNFEVGQWTKIGTITVAINETVEATAITNRNIPDPSKDEGYYGFVFRKSGEAFNSFDESSSISMHDQSATTQSPVETETGMSGFGMSCHRLTNIEDGPVINLVESEQDDTNTGDDSIPTEISYNYYKNTVGAQFGNQSEAYYPTKQSANNKTYLTRSWTRSWWFRYPTQEELDASGLSDSDLSFFHTTDEIANKNVNVHNDLTLSGFLVAAPPTPDTTLKITGIQHQNPGGISPINLTNHNLPSVEDTGGVSDGLTDFAYLIPSYGIPKDGASIKITGNIGAQFRLEFDQVDLTEFQTGKSIGEASFGRSTLDWDEELVEDSAADFGTTGVITIPEAGHVIISFPQVPSHSDVGQYRNYYLRVMAEGGTEIMQSAFESQFGADIFDSNNSNAQNFSQGLNWINYSGNTAQIRYRQQGLSQVNLDPYWYGEKMQLNTALTNGTQVATLVNNSGGMLGNGGIVAEQVGGSVLSIPFKFTIRGGDPGNGHFELNDSIFEMFSDIMTGTDLQSFSNNNEQHETFWGASHPCNPPTTVSPGVRETSCSLSDLNDYESVTGSPNYDEPLITHDFPGSTLLGDVDLNQLPWPGDGVEYTDLPDGWNQDGLHIGTANLPSYITISRAAGNGETDHLYHTVSLEAGKTYRLAITIVNGFNLTPHYSGAQPRFYGYLDADNNQIVGGTGSEYDGDMFSNQLFWFKSDTGQNLVASGTLEFETEITALVDFETKVELVLRHFQSSGTNNTGNNAIDISNFVFEEVTTAQTYTDHYLSSQTDEDVSISHLQVVRGKVDEELSSNWNGDVTTLTVSTDGTWDEYITLLGLLNINSFGASDNNYQLHMDKIATWIPDTG
tara:strand:- start:6580 stop:9810 length:3231 start_codon:yes stop_codon:yes gene_type:complete